jgi:hypothetical protein
MTACVNTSNFSSELPFFRVNLGRWIGRIAALLRELGPYAVIELVLPGGSLIALSLWLFRRYKNARPIHCAKLGASRRLCLPR